jgi:hypothetical protein
VHKIEINSMLQERISVRRGRLHPFDRPDGARIAHVVVDLQNGFMAPGAVAEIPTAREIVASVNSISAAVRRVGGLVVYLRLMLDAEVVSSQVRENKLSDPFPSAVMGGIQETLPVCIWAGSKVEMASMFQAITSAVFGVAACMAVEPSIRQANSPRPASGRCHGRGAVRAEGRWSDMVAILYVGSRAANGVSAALTSMVRGRRAAAAAAD